SGVGQSVCTPACAARLDEESANQKRLQSEEGDRGDYAPLVSLPHRELAETNDAARRQAVLANTPTLKLAPVEHGSLEIFLDGDVFRPYPVYDPHRDIRQFGGITFLGPDIAPDDSAADHRVRPPVDRYFRLMGDAFEDVPSLQQPAPWVQDLLPHVKNHGVVWKSPNPGRQFIWREVG